MEALNELLTAGFEGRQIWTEIKSLLKWGQDKRLTKLEAFAAHRQPSDVLKAAADQFPKEYSRSGPRDAWAAFLPNPGSTSL